MHTIRKIPLLHGPYTAPKVRVGDRVHCHVRDRDVIVKRWSDALIPWPIGRAPVRSAGMGIIIEEELARAIQCESALAIRYWWGIQSQTTLGKWRRALEVTRTNNEGSQLLIHAATAKALEIAREVGLSDEERQRRSDLVSEMRLWERSPEVTYGVPWTAEAGALLGTIPDAEAARRTGHTLNAVRIRRRNLGIPCLQDEPVGATLERRTGRWCANISVNGTRVSLGTYDTREEAHQVYLDAVRRYRGGSSG